MSNLPRLPTYCVSHGGGPWPWMKGHMLPVDTKPLEAALQAIPREIGVLPKAVLVVSAHWEERDITVQTHPNPPMYYDYSGFPKHTYSIQYSSPGSPEVAARVQELLSNAGIKTRADPTRGYDHGCFVPLYVMYPAADVPVLELSLKVGLNPREHLAVGKALAPLRDEGVLIVGSGVPAFHSFSRSRSPVDASRDFEAWLTRTCVNHKGAERAALLETWEVAPRARDAHGREEHLLPLMVAVGAAHEDVGVRQFHSTAWQGTTEVGYRFGAAAYAAAESV